MFQRNVRSPWRTVVWWLFGLCLSASVWARGPQPGPSTADGLPVMAWVDLPRQAQQVWEQIHNGGPFRYGKDGTVFFNRERLLPREKRGFYREYTVPTPGLGHRGARRLVCGGMEPTAPVACYYTADHYASFARVVR
jgi:ribonuclease T1